MVLVAAHQKGQARFDSRGNEHIVAGVAAQGQDLVRLDPSGAGTEVVQQALAHLQAEVTVKLGAVKATAQFFKGGAGKNQTTMAQDMLHQSVWGAFAGEGRAYQHIGVEHPISLGHSATRRAGSG